MTQDPKGSSPYRRLFRNRQLTRLLVGEFVSSIGDWLYLVALLVIIYQVTQDAFILGVVGAARMLPMLLLSIPAGIVADRYDRRVILLVSDIARGVLMVVLGILVGTNAPVIAIVAVAITAASVATFFGPALGAYLPTVVGDERDLGPANSLWATLDNLAFFIGPAVAGVLIAIGGLQVGFFLNAVSFAFVALILWTLPSGKPGAGEVAETAEGPADTGGTWRQIAPRISGPILVDAATSFAGGGLSVLTVLISVDQLGAGEAGVGYLNAATGIGGIAAGFVAGALVLRRLDVPLLGGSIVGGIGLLALSLSRDLAPGLVLIAIAVGALLLLDIIVTTLVQRLVADNQRGRAMGILQLTGFSSVLLGSLILPAAASFVAVPVVLVALGVIVVVMCLLAVVVLRRQGVLSQSTVDPQRVALLQSSIFAGLPFGRVEAAARQLAPVAATAGQVIVRQGDPADRFYLIEDGRFTVTQTGDDGTERTLRGLGPGEVFGEIGLLRSTPRTATVTASTEGRLLALDREPFLELAGSGPGLSTRLLDLYRTGLTQN